MKQKIYIVEYCPQRSGMVMQAQTANPSRLLMEAALSHTGGIRMASVRPLMLNGRQVER